MTLEEAKALIVERFDDLSSELHERCKYKGAAAVGRECKEVLAAIDEAIRAERERAAKKADDCPVRED